MNTILITNGVHKPLLGKEKMLSSLTTKQKDDMDAKALAIIQLCLSNKVLYKVRKEKTATDLWTKKLCTPQKT